MKPRAKPRTWPILLASGIGLVILLWLGLWQVQRLAEKEAQISALDAQLAELPMSLAKAIASGDINNRKLLLTGKLDGLPLLKIATLNGGPGFEVIQSFTMEGGAPMLVSRGIAAEGQAPAELKETVEITGIIKRHDGGKGLFDPDNNAATNRWYWWDVTAMHQASGGKAVRHATDVLHLLPGSPGTEGLHVDPPKASLRNNHLGYAITWFGLAAVLVVMTGVFLRGRGTQS